MKHQPRNFLPLLVVLLLLNTSFALCLDDDDDDDGSGSKTPSGWPPKNVDATTSIGPDNEVTVAVNPTDPDNLVAGSKDYALGPAGNGRYYVWAGYFYSKNGGLTWKDGLVGRQAGSVLLNYEHSTDPVVAFGPDGTAYYCGLAYGSGFAGQGGSALRIAESRNGGETWEDPYIVMAWETYTAFHDKQWLIVDQSDPDRLYLTWTPFIPAVPPEQGYNSRIYFGRSFDGGDNWDYYQLSDYVVTNDDVQGTSLAVGSDGVLSVIYIDYEERKLVLTQNDQQGDPEDWTTPRNIADVDWVYRMPDASYRVPTMPALAADPSTGNDDATLYAVWHDNRSGNTDIALIRSTDGGSSWSEPVMINDDDTEHDQFFPGVAVSPEGEVGVVFYDRRDDKENALLELYLAWSPDGEMWLPNLKVTTNASNGSYGYHQSGGAFMGDYIGIAISDEAAHPVWADTRLGYGQSHLFTARVELEGLRDMA